jgi:hypothetical protein
MKRLFGLLCAILFASGCLSPSDRGMWDEALKDARGDRSQMRSGSEFQGADLPTPTMAPARR